MLLIDKHLTAESEVLGSHPGVALSFKFLLIFNSNKKSDRNINKNPCENYNNCSREQRTILGSSSASVVFVKNVLVITNE